mgnify:CR=1 FL=1
MKPHLVSTKLGVLTLFLSCLASCAETPPPVATSNARLSAVQIDRVGRRIWQNECGGTVAGLTSWNVGEDFASLGIGHFIWYPQGQSGPFEESFPPLAAFLAARGHGVPGWMRGSCPWPTKSARRRCSTSRSSPSPSPLPCSRCRSPGCPVRWCSSSHSRLRRRY